METNRWKFLLSSIAALVLVLGVTDDAAAKAYEQTSKVGKKSEITLRADSRVGDQVLVAGRYRVQHRTEGEEHFVRFIRLYDRQRAETDVKCRVEPEARKIRQTSVHVDTAGGMRRITRIAVKGENRSHWLSSWAD